MNNTALVLKVVVYLINIREMSCTCICICLKIRKGGITDLNDEYFDISVEERLEQLGIKN